MSIKNSTIVVASFILIGRIAGFIREWLLSSISGANAETDVAVVLFTFPDLIVSLLLGGGLSSSLIPYLGSLEKQKKKKFVRQLTIYIGLIFLILSLLISIKLDILWNLLAPGIGQEVKRGAKNYFLIILFCLPLTSISGFVYSESLLEKLFRKYSLNNFEYFSFWLSLRFFLIEPSV